MSLAHTAEYLKKHGRGPDDQLVHMSSNELRGLQNLAMAHGGSLTINPHTGLPEAGFLDSVLPMVLGAGLMMTGIGAPAAALMVGAGYGIAKHDLNAGLMAGLGAYGGAGLASGLAGAGAAAADAATNTAANTAAQLGVEGASTGAGSQAAMLAEQNAGMGTQGLQSVGNAASTATGAGAQAAIPASPSYLENVGKGVTSLGNEAGRSAFMAAAPTGTIPAAGYTVANALSPQQGVPNQLESPDSNPMKLDRLSPNFKGYEPERPNPYYKPQYANYTQNPYAPRQMAEGGMAMGGQPNQMYPMSQQEHTNFMEPSQLPTSAMAVRDFEPATNPMTGTPTQPMAKGGIASYASGGHLSSSAGIPDVGIFYDNNLTTKNLPAWNAAQAGYKQIAKRAKVKNVDLPKTSIENLGGDYSDAGASGGIATLGSYSDGGRLLKGPGDGMSDNIPAQIGKHQPARLADGEFVVPADVVSHLGNGSTEAGAKKLYAMMDKVRKARTGRKAQGKQINANKFLPA
jgi:hypothetical protein